MRFKDQGVLVTGGASGIGEKVVAAFGREGAVVAVGDRDEKGAERVAEAVRKAGGRAHAFALDVTDPKGVASFVARGAERLGRLDVLVNSAGVREISSVLDLPLEEWNRVMGVNITGTFLCSQAFGADGDRQGRQGRHRQPRLDAGRGGGVEAPRLHGLQACRRRADQGDGDGARRARASASMRWGPA